MGGMPTPPPTSKARGRFGSGRNGWPIGPSTLMTSPAWRRLSARSPGPTIL